jgi:hypothetical protein
MQTMTSFARAFAGLIALLAWSTLLLQYVLLIDATWNDIGPWLGTLRYVSFFTILGNFAVAMTTTFALFKPRTSLARFFACARVRGATALYIAVVCGIYYVLLASTWAPQGAQLVADILLHYVMPALYVAWWIVCVPHGRLAWSDALRWLALPAAFLAWSLLRGAWLHEYPYPFIDVDTLGFATVLRNALGIALLFVFGGGLVVAFDRFAARSGKMGAS